jgi:hypothetical protein
LRIASGAAESPLDVPIRPSIKPLDVIADSAGVETAKPADAASSQRDPASA